MWKISSITDFTNKIIMAFMSSTNVYSQTSCLRKGFIFGFFTKFTFVTLNKCFDVSLQAWCLSKWFPTKFAFVIFMSLMNCVDVILQIIFSRKWFITRYTFFIFMSFMNCVDMFLQILCKRKWFTTSYTFVIFVTFMNCINVLLQGLFRWKWFHTRFAYVILIYLHLQSINFYLAGKNFLRNFMNAQTIT